MIIHARAPLRLGLAGGGTDVSPYCDEYGGLVLNATIDRYAYAGIKDLKNGNIRFVASDIGVIEELPLSVEIELTGRLQLHRAVYNEMVLRYNNSRPLAIEINTSCDAPPGSGLGSSSTLVVVMIKAFAEYLKLHLDNYAIAQLAFDIERKKCQLQGGRQDQYSAAFGGFNFMEFNPSEKVVINPLRVEDWIISELEASLMLFYSGVSRESASIIAEQSANLESKVFKTVDAMNCIKQEAVEMKECLLKGDFSGIVNSMKKGWEEKKRSAGMVSNSSLDRLMELAINAGALAGKISGAGGGGFMMFFVPLERRVDIQTALASANGQFVNFGFTNDGAKAWRLE